MVATSNVVTLDKVVPIKIEPNCSRKIWQVNPKRKLHGCVQNAGTTLLNGSGSVRPAKLTTR